MSSVDPSVQALIAQGRFEEAAEALARLPAPTTEERLCRGRLLGMMGRTEQATAVLWKAAATAGDDADLRAECLVEMATAYGRRGDRESYARARDLVAEVERLSDHPRIRGLAGLVRAALALKRDGHAEALPLLLRARATLEPFPAEHVRALDATGACWAALGDTVRGRAFLEHAVQKKQELGDRYGLAISYGQLGRLHLRLGEPDEAERALRQDLALCRAIGDSQGEAQCLNHLGQVALLREDPARARVELAAARRLTRPEGVAHALLLKDEADAARLAGDLDEAARLAAEALEATARTDHRYGRALCEQVAGRVALSQGELAQAEKWLRSAAVTLRELEARLERIPVLLDLARCHRELGHHDAFVGALAKALAIAEAARADNWVARLEQLLEEADPTRWLEQVLAKVQGTGPRGPSSTRLDYALRAESRFVVVLFTDIVGFTAWSAEREATEVVETLNDYFSRMAEAVVAEDGIIDKYIGDGLMVLFSDDAPEAELVARSCRCALDMLARLEAWNQDRRLTEREPLRMRLGMNAGLAVVGNMGSYLKVARSAVGRVVNLASRLEQLGEPNRVLCGAEVARLAAPDFEFAEGGQVLPKGLPAQPSYWLEGRRRPTSPPPPRRAAGS